MSIYLSLSIYLYLSISIYLSLSIYLYLSISIYLYLYLSISLSIYLSISIYIYLYLSISIYIYLYLSISIYIYLYLSISIYIYLYLSISIYIYLYLSISIYIYLYLWLPIIIFHYLSLSIYLSIYLSINNIFNMHKVSKFPEGIARETMNSWNLGSYWQMTFALFSFSLLAVWCNPGVDRPLFSELVPPNRRGKVIGWWPLCSNWDYNGTTTNRYQWIKTFKGTQWGHLVTWLDLASEWPHESWVWGSDARLLFPASVKLSQVAPGNTYYFQGWEPLVSEAQPVVDS